jgi:hypothetical protein
MPTICHRSPPQQHKCSSRQRSSLQPQHRPAHPKRLCKNHAIWTCCNATEKSLCVEECPGYAKYNERLHYLSHVSVSCRKVYTVDDKSTPADAGAAPAVLPLQSTASTCGRQHPAHLRQLLAARGRFMQVNHESCWMAWRVPHAADACIIQTCHQSAAECTYACEVLITL